MTPALELRARQDSVDARITRLEHTLASIGRRGGAASPEGPAPFAEGDGDPLARRLDHVAGRLAALEAALGVERPGTASSLPPASAAGAAPALASPAAAASARTSSVAPAPRVSTALTAASLGAPYAPGQAHPPAPAGSDDRPRYETVGETVKRLGGELERLGVAPYAFVRAPPDYYERDLEYRRSVLGASSVRHLCKTIVLRNTRAHPSVRGTADPDNSEYYAVVVQYATRMDAKKLAEAVWSRANRKGEGGAAGGSGGGGGEGASGSPRPPPPPGRPIAKKYFNFRLAPEDVSDAMTGFVHNAVTPVGSKTRIPLVLSHEITQLEPPFFWLGGGEPDLKLGVDLASFVEGYDPWILDCTDGVERGAPLDD